jgi:hypothetical protein
LDQSGANYDLFHANLAIPYQRRIYIGFIPISSRKLSIASIHLDQPLSNPLKRKVGRKSGSYPQRAFVCCARWPRATGSALFSNTPSLSPLACDGAAVALLLEAAPVAPLYFNTKNWLKSPRVQGWREDRCCSRDHTGVSFSP